MTKETETVSIPISVLKIILAYIETNKAISELQKQKEKMEIILSAWGKDIEKFLKEGLTNK